MWLCRETCIIYGEQILLSPVYQGHFPWKLRLVHHVQAFPQDARGGVGNSTGGSVYLGASQPWLGGARGSG